jgi:tRNA dimethylallyltransferase
VPHHLYGIVPPDNNFSAADYCREARKTIRSILNGNRLPVVCGGTGLYLKVLLGGINSSPPADHALRRELTEFADSRGNQALLDQLAAVDPETAARLNANDRVRIIRALEVYRQSGTPFSSFHSEHGFSEEWCRTLKIGIEADRNLLYERIEQRVDRMFSDGLVDEVKNLVAAGYSPQLKSMSSIGYKEVCSYLAGGMTLAETVELVKRNTRRYAKRQLTWFRSDAAIRWFRYPESLDEIFAAADEFLNADDGRNKCGAASN